MLFRLFCRYTFKVWCAVAIITQLPGCCPTRQSVKYVKPKLISIHIVDRNGLSETISNPERLCEFECVDFLRSQPYKKVLRIFSRDSCGNTRAIITSYYENGQVQKYLETVNNRASGRYREWHENGTTHLEVNVIGGMADITPAAENSWVFDGIGQVWNECGNLVACISYCRGKLEGDSLYYYPGGQLWKRIPFSSGKQHGTFTMFYKEGNILQEIEYRDDKREGTAHRYWNCGSLASEECYICDKLMQGKYLDPKGNLICSVENGSGQRAVFSAKGVREFHTYQEGIEEGEVRHLNDDGLLIKTWSLRHGEKHGPEIEYFPASNQPKLQVDWYEGKIQGLVRTWYSNGVQESQKEMSGNARNGILTAWYHDGSLMMVEEYENDNLVKGEYYRLGQRSPVSEIEHGDGTAILYNPEGTLIRKIYYRHGKPYESS